MVLFQFFKVKDTLNQRISVLEKKLSCSKASFQGFRTSYTRVSINKKLQLLFKKKIEEKKKGNKKQTNKESNDSVKLLELQYSLIL